MEINDDVDDSFFNPHEDGNEGRGPDGELEAGLPGGRGEEVINQHNEAILRQQKRAKAAVVKGTTETRDAISKTPMGPELRPTEAPAPATEDDEAPGNHEYEAYKSAERDDNGNLVRDYKPGR